MPPVPTELADKKDFQGDILDREIKIVFDPTKKEYLYDYAEKTADATKALDTIKYYRISSPKLSEVEQAVVARQTKTSAAPRVPGPKGEITKASEAQLEAYEKAGNLYGPLQEKFIKKIPLSPEEETKLYALNENIDRLERPAKIMSAKKVYNLVQSIKNTKGTRNLNEGTYPEQHEKVLALLRQALIEDPSLPRDLIEKYELANQILGAESVLEDIASKKNLNEGNQKMKKAMEEFLNTLPPPRYVSSKQIKNNALEKQQFNNARAKYAQLIGTYPDLNKSSPDLSKLPAEARKNYDEAYAVIAAYAKKYPDRMAKLREQYAELRRLAESKKTEGPNNIPTIGESLNKPPTTPELSNAALQVRRDKAQAILRSIPTGILSKPLEKLQRNAQLVVSSFDMLGRANVTSEDKKIARNTIEKSIIEKNAQTLGVITGGSRRRTKKVKKSRRKTKRRHH